MKRYAIIFAVVLAFLMLSPALAQEPPDSTMKSEVLWHASKAMFPTQIMFPANFDPEKSHTLILALHGYGSSAEAFRRVGKPFVERGYLVALPEAAYPFLIEKGKLGFDWWLYHVGNDSLVERAAELLVQDQLPAVVNDLRQRYQIDKVYVLGFSQGAITAFPTGISNKELFDGIISFSLGAVFDTAWFRGETLAEGHDVRVLLLHGQNDERVPIKASERARDVLQENGYDVTFRSFKGGHMVPLDQLDFVMNWIEEESESGQ